MIEVFSDNLYLFKTKKELNKFLLSKVELDNPVMSYSKKGRPFIEKSTYDFNISNKENLFLLGLEKKLRIGVDLEKIDKNTDVETFKKFVLCPSEKTAFNFLVKDLLKSPLEAITLIWSIKEAAFKSLDTDFIPKEITVDKIVKNGVFQLKMNGKTKRSMGHRTNLKGEFLFYSGYIITSVLTDIS